MSFPNHIHPKLTECKKCKTYNFTTHKHPFYGGCVMVSCTSCNQQWYICIEHNLRFNNNNLTKLHNHFKHSHVSNPTATITNNATDDKFEMTEDNESFYDGLDSECSSPHHKKPRHNPSCEQQLSSIQSTSTNVLSNTALQHIICTAFSNSELLSTNLQSDEINFHLNVTDFCSNITEAKQVQFMDIIHQLLTTKFQHTRPPTSHQDLRRFYISGKNSIYRNIPCPLVLEIDNHAYVPIKDILQLSLNTLDNISIIPSSNYNRKTNTISSLIESSKSKNILRMINQKYANSNIDPHVIFVTFWSDDFEVNHTRRNHNSTWIKTMSIVSSTKTDISKHYTNVVALGNKGYTHDLINERINDELIELQKINYYYVSQKKAMLPIVVYPLAVLADRPERCSLNHTLSFSGNSTRRWLYSSLTPPEKLASCRQCNKQRLLKFFRSSEPSRQNTNTCGRCCDFDFLSSSKSAEFLPPKHYPTSKHDNSPNLPEGRDIIQNPRTETLRPIKLSYDKLTNGVTAACFNLFTKQWKIIETRVYLKTLGISSSLIQKIIDHTTRMEHEQYNVTECIAQLPLPKIWTDQIFTIDQFIETPMHHLFEGIVKSLIEVTMEYLKFHKLWSKYCEMINPLLNEIDTLKLDFCRVESFWCSTTDYKPTGWIAENYLGFSRIIIVLLTYMDTLEIQQRRGYDEFKCMIQSSFVLISHLMSRKNISSLKINELVKIFLSTCENFDLEFRERNDNTPFWYKKSNFVSLLNLPDQIDEYGSVFLYWEGVRERYIQYVKPILKNKRKTGSFLVSKLQQLLQQNSLELIKHRFQKTSPKYYLKFTNIHIYTTKDKFKTQLQQEEPLSIVITQDIVTQYLVIYKNNDNYECVQVLFDDSLGFHSNNLWYAPILLHEENKKCSANLEDVYNMDRDISGILLSVKIIVGTGLCKSGFALITSEWTVRRQNGTLDLPNLSKDLFGIQN